MTEQQRQFSIACDRLTKAVVSSGFPAELATLCAKQIGSPKGIDRLTSYVESVRPGKLEMIVDEMLAIDSQIRGWKEKKESEVAQWRYTLWLNSDEREGER